MKRIILQSLLLTLLVFTFTACSKYDEGSKFTVLTKKARMINSWKILKLTADDIDITSGKSITEVDIRKNGGLTARGEFLGFPISSEGTWAFSSDKAKLIVTAENGTISAYDIIKLKNNELKVTITENGIFYVHEYVSK